MTKGCRGSDRMLVGFTNTYAISAYHHQKCEFESRSWQDVLDTKQSWSFTWLGQWFSTVKTDHHNITEIFLKVALNTISLMPYMNRILSFRGYFFCLRIHAM